MLQRSLISDVRALFSRAFPWRRQVPTYLQLAHEGKSVVTITRELGLHSRSYVHRQIQRQALELVTEAFQQLARQAHLSGNER
jgi:hypothetical protein